MKSNKSGFEGYKNSWRNLALTREDGVLQMRLHTDDGPLLWGAREGSVHDQIGEALREINRDRGNRVLILTGSGDAFCAGMNMQEMPPPEETDAWLRLMREGTELLMALVDLEIPVIAAVNGPALIHAELAVLSDIVLASESAVFADSPHIPYGVVPGDGAHVVWPMLLGPNRGRYFLLTGQQIAAAEALTLGIVGEVLAHDALLPRAWTLARQLVALPEATSRYSRIALMQPFKRAMLNGLGHGLALEGLALAALGR
jgi:enoyl-CoA hydratase/carnithine racemase